MNPDIKDWCRLALGSGFEYVAIIKELWSEHPLFIKDKDGLDSVRYHDGFIGVYRVYKGEPDSSNLLNTYIWWRLIKEIL